MKVLDLHCSQGHVFEGWFGSEDDFQQQRTGGLLQCPMCGCTTIDKGLSAPRLNLGAAAPEKSAPAQQHPEPVPQDRLRAMQAAWLKVSRELARTSEDVGDRFAEQALGMHRGELEEKPIRGQATSEQARELLEEGVPVLPLMLPKASTDTLQ